PMPEWRCSSLYQRKNRPQKVCASSKQPKRSGNSGRYFMVRNWLSEYGLSLEQCGRLCDLVTPRQASRNPPGLAVIGEPRMLSCLSSGSRLHVPVVWRLEEVVDLAGDVALETADDLELGVAFGDAAG